MTQIEVTFLGTTAGVPTKYRNHPSLYVRYQSENEFCYLFDCGEGTQRQIFSSGLNFMRISDIFITHWHADHFAGLLGIMETMGLEKRKEPLTIYGPEAENFVEILMELGYSTKSFEIRAKNVNFEGTEIEKVLDMDEFYIAAIPVKHKIPAVAYAFIEKDRVRIDKEKTKKFDLPEKGLIYKKIKMEGSVSFHGRTILLEEISATEKGKKVVYSGDTVACKNILKISEDADLLIHDSTFFMDELDGSYNHTTFNDVLKIAKEANVKNIILTHISRRYQDVEELKDKIKSHENVRIAKDFMKVVV